MNIYILKLKSSNWPSVEKSLININYTPIPIDIPDVISIKEGSILIIRKILNRKCMMFN